MGGGILGVPSSLRPEFLVVVFVLIVCKVGAQNENEGGNFTEADYYSMVPYYDSEMMSSHQNYSSAPFGYRPGSATRSNSCQHVRAVPSHLRSRQHMKPHGLSSFYQKYTEAYGIPVLSSRYVSDPALRRACYTLRFLLASHSAVRQSFYRMSGRVAVIGVNEGTTSIPEHSHLPPWWNQRARGLGATPSAPVSTGGEENVLCLRTDRYNQDIYLHESAHGVHLLGAAYGIPGWDRRLRSLYNQARSRGLWANTYSMSTPEEYFVSSCMCQRYFYFYLSQLTSKTVNWTSQNGEKMTTKGEMRSDCL
ncbi:uncharacterized protein LOC101864584 [Aplysia californica]|uniref:Uncharacterized protein LOC101864584 n=1 Tax=Aplysia californica TaxID=6500 RepID=A0ABM0JD16_APLCA|nr:uncharacterized protein LOC101864584 [Aplysia californica]